MLLAVLLLVAQAGADRPAGETRKHLQVLQNVPESQLFLVMNAVALSLDVHCDYCHVREGERFQWERDDKPKKDVARKMMKMVMDLNASSFGGTTAVTCFTCHRGSTKASASPPLPPHYLTSPSAAPPLPSARAVLDAYVTAVGGREAAGKFTTTVMRGTDERSDGRTAVVEYILKAPDKALVTRTTGQTAASQGMDGSSGWTRTGTEVRALTPDQIRQFRRGIALLDPMKVRETADALAVSAIEVIDGRPAYAVVAKAAESTVRYFFDAQNGLLLRQVTSTPRGVVFLQEQIDFEDYRDVDGVRLPFTIRFANVAPYDTSIRRLSEIRHDVSVDDARFRQGGEPRQ